MADKLRDAEAFLSALAPDGELTFQTFDEANSSTKGLSRVLHGRFRQHANMLEALNDRGAGCFVMVNRGDMGGRKQHNVQAIRALFVDLDGAPLEPVIAAPLSPPITCESSPGKYHAYWPVADMPLSAFRMAQRALAAKYGGDPKVCDLPRVMRIPGFVHRKAEPFQSKLLHCDPMIPWNWPDFAEAMGLPYANKDTDIRQRCEGERNNYLYRFAYGLRRQGLDLCEALRRVNIANTNSCVPPLNGAEVEGIVVSAWHGEIKGFVMLPYSLLDSPAYRGLPHPAKTALTALVRRHNGRNNGRLTFTRSEASRYGMDKRMRTRALKALEVAGISECTEHGKSASPGYRATTDRFRLHFLDG